MLECHCHEDVFALMVPCDCSACGWCCRGYTGLCHKLRLGGPASLPLQFNVPGVLAAGPAVSRVFPEGRCSQAGFSAPLLSSLITETSSSTSGSNLVTWECISPSLFLSSLPTCSIAPGIYRRLFCLRLLHSVCGCLLHPHSKKTFVMAIWCRTTSGAISKIRNRKVKGFDAIGNKELGILTF